MKNAAVKPFSGYAKNVRPAPDPELTDVSPGSPCGEYFRRHWIPVALERSVGDRPTRIRILCEDLVLFRDLSGRLGLLHLHCTHRGASLEWGIPKERGLQCCYHGWTYDVDGTCLQCPGEPAGSTLHEKVVQGAYPVEVWGGLVFAYMGPPEYKPPFPYLDTMRYPEGSRIVPYVFHYPCNWLQSHENGADLAHLVFLHTLASGTQFVPELGKMPQLDFFDTPTGVLSLQVRRIGGVVWARASDMIPPSQHQFSGVFYDMDKSRYAHFPWAIRWITPVDNENNLTIGVRHFNPSADPESAGNPDAIGEDQTDIMGQTENRPYRERQLHPGDFEAITGQGRIAAHKAEFLGSTDNGVVKVRNQLRRAIRKLGKGGGVAYPQPNAHGVIPTYNIEVMHPLPVQAGDAAAVLDFGRAVIRIAIETAGHDPATREQEIRRRVHAAYPPA
jgi:phenylpropionate dioxygenase-like ring-hydroxylating dioxygenase large terminal subunit